MRRRKREEYCKFCLSLILEHQQTKNSICKRCGKIKAYIYRDVYAKGYAAGRREHDESNDVQELW